MIKLDSIYHRMRASWPASGVSLRRGGTRRTAPRRPPGRRAPCSRLHTAGASRSGGSSSKQGRAPARQRQSESVVPPLRGSEVATRRVRALCHAASAWFCHLPSCTAGCCQQEATRLNLTTGLLRNGMLTAFWIACAVQRLRRRWRCSCQRSPTPRAPGPRLRRHPTQRQPAAGRPHTRC